MEEAFNSIFLWLANLWVSMGRLTDYTFGVCQQAPLSWQDWRDMGSTATWEVPCEETHRVRH